MSTTTDNQRRQARSGAAVRAAIDKNIGRLMQEINGWELRISPVLDYAMVYSDLAGSRILISEDTWTTLASSSEGSSQFFSKFMRGNQASGLSNLSGADWWVRAQRTEASKVSNNVIRAKDEYRELEEQMERLIVAASGLADGSTAVEHLQDFFSQLVVARGKLEGYRERFTQLEGVLDLAEDVVAALR